MIKVEDAIQILNDQRPDFDTVANKLSHRRDLHAFMLLDKLLPDDIRIIGCAAHDQIYIQVELDELCEVATPEDMVELAKCGLLYSKSEDSLYMFA